MILKAPHPKLKQISVDCTFAEGQSIGNKLTKAIEEATPNAKEHKIVIVGLAAPQIGINKRVFVAQGQVFINPKVVRVSDKTCESREGCLSLGDDAVFVTKRPMAVSLRWTDGSRTLRSHIFTGNAATIVMHEMEHLEGVLCNEH